MTSKPARSSDVLNLPLEALRVLAVLVQEASVTRAARRLHLTQPAISNTLSKLRELLGDPLLIRQGQVMVATPRALEIEREIWPMLESLATIASKQPQFDPKQSQREFTIGMAPYLEVLLAPALVRLVVQPYIGLRLNLRYAHETSLGDGLDSGLYDLAISLARPYASWHEGIHLINEPFVVLFDPRHHSHAKRMSLKRYLALPQVMVSFTGEARGQIDDLLESRGLQRKLAVVVSQFAALPGVIEGSERIANVPLPFARECAARSALRYTEPPLDVAPIAVSAVWHRRNGQNTALAWLIQQVREALYQSEPMKALLVEYDKNRP